MTHYEVLGVDAGASVAEIRRAYVTLARRHHPDFHVVTGHGSRAEAQREMQRINEAWSVLRDPVRRGRYDRTLELDGRRLAAPGAAPTGGWVPGSGTAHPDFVPVDDGDDDGEVFDEDLDAGRGRPVPRWQQVLPVALLVASMACLCVGLVANLRPVLGLGVTLLGASAAGFVLTPMLAVLRTHESDPD